ncbi:MAG: hypothetical protein K9I74_10750 [Bacteroidales bacterium]|nr:hypothetical protein [Bacteroidales bacterium]
MDEWMNGCMDEWMNEEFRFNKFAVALVEQPEAARMWGQSEDALTNAEGKTWRNFRIPDSKFQKVATQRNKAGFGNLVSS